MVRPVLRLFALCLLLSVAGLLVAAELRLEMGKTTVERGKALRAVVLYRGHRDQGNIDFSPWREQVYVEHRYSEVTESESGDTLRRESVWIHPRASGGLRLPALTYAGVRTGPVDLRVLPPGTDDAPLSLASSVSATRVKTGEQVVIQATLVTRVPEGKVAVEKVNAPRVESHLLAPGRTELPDDTGQVRHNLGWSLFVNEPGRHLIELPPLRHTRFGRNLGIYHLPLVALEVDPLPAYLPVTVPVGGLEIRSHIEGAGDTRRWRVVVESRGRLPVGLPALESTLAGLAGLNPDALQIDIRTEAGPEGVYSIADYRAPLPRYLSGIGGGPRLTVPHFDPSSNRVQRLDHYLPREWRLPVWSVWVMALGGSIFILVLLYVVQRVWRAWRTNQQFIRRIEKSSDPHVLRRTLLAPGHHRTSSEWAAQWQDPDAVALAARVNAFCFAADSGNRFPGGFANLKSDTARLIRRLL